MIFLTIWKNEFDLQQMYNCNFKKFYLKGQMQSTKNTDTIIIILQFLVLCIKISLMIIYNKVKL